MRHVVNARGGVDAIDDETGETWTCLGVYKAMQAVFCRGGKFLPSLKRRWWRNTHLKPHYKKAQGLAVETAILAWIRAFTANPGQCPTDIPGVARGSLIHRLAVPACRLLKEQDWVLVAEQMPVGEGYVGTRVDAILAPRASSTKTLGPRVRQRGRLKRKSLPEFIVLEIKLSDTLQDRTMTEMTGILAGKAATRQLLANIQATWAAYVLDRNYPYRFSPYVLVARRPCKPAKGTQKADPGKAELGRVPKEIYSLRAKIVASMARARKARRGHALAGVYQPAYPLKPAERVHAVPDEASRESTPKRIAVANRVIVPLSTSMDPLPCPGAKRSHSASDSDGPGARKRRKGLSGGKCSESASAGDALTASDTGSALAPESRSATPPLPLPHDYVDVSSGESGHGDEDI